MKRYLSIPVVLGAILACGWAKPFVCLNCGVHCMEPQPYCPDCGCPCDKGFHFCSARRSEHTHKIISDLSCDSCCDRIRAAEKLGCRIHADWCCDGEVVPALAHAVQFDSCWEVRKAAAWSLAYQNARTEPTVISLYLASKLDPHYLVRDAANDALGVLLVCRQDCYKDLFDQLDRVVKKLKGRYKPGTPEYDRLVDGYIAGLGAPPIANILPPDGKVQQ